MRNITLQAVQALHNSKTFKSSNTRVDGEVYNPALDWSQGPTETKIMVLHGNTILATNKETTHFNLCGWNTPTTRERINGFFAFYEMNLKIVQRDFTPHAMNTRTGELLEINSDGWNDVQLICGALKIVNLLPY